MRILRKWLIRKRQESNLPSVPAHAPPDLKSRCPNGLNDLTAHRGAFSDPSDYKTPQFTPHPYVCRERANYLDLFAPFQRCVACYSEVTT